MASGSLEAGEVHPRSGNESVSREITFELTFANSDLIWFGDPASPRSMVYLKPNSQPIATDVCVRALHEDHERSQRRYMHESRIAVSGDTRTVYAFTSQREKVIGTIDNSGRFSPNEFYQRQPALLPSWPQDASKLVYDGDANALYYEVGVPGPVIRETLDFLPLRVTDVQGNRIDGHFSVEYVPDDGDTAPAVSLVFAAPQNVLTLAHATVPQVFCQQDVQLGSFNNESGTYLPDAAYRPGADADNANAASATFSFAGNWTPVIDADQASLVVVDSSSQQIGSDTRQTQIMIDGQFDDWRNVAGMDDPRGDLVPYLEYVPDVDLLEFKVAHDDHHIYLYARVAGQIGRSHPDGGRSYFYAYMDVDQNPNTGFLPTRDDDCYFGVEIGDDCEVQFEFVNNRLRKTFYGFCGLGGNEQVLNQIVTLGKSQYGRFDGSGHERADYKAEYIYRNGKTEITKDLKLGTSDTIQLAISPDGREVEVKSTYSGFLKNHSGRPIVALGQTIDLAIGMECDSKAYPAKSRWAADSTMPIRGYRLSRSPAE